MKIYILCDMEGVSGIRKIEQVQLDNPEYAEGRELMMADMNAAIEAAFAAGATEVVACDTHAGGGQVRMADMDARAVYDLPQGTNMMPALDKSFDGVVLLGHHARAGTLNGFLDHTMNSKAWFAARINNKVVGEMAIEAAFAGHFGVPVIMVSGDEATAKEARADLGRVETAVVKWGVGRNHARCLPLPRAHDAIRVAMKRALRSIGRFRPFKPKLPATFQITFYRSDMSEELGSRPGFERVDSRTVRRRVESFHEIMRGTW